jgi:glycine hydroxymethyltransferase
MSILDEYNQLYKELTEFERTKIPLCAAENYVSDFVRQPLNSLFEGKYSCMSKDGTESFIGGEYVVRLNELLQKQCLRTFGAKYVNADTMTGMNCFSMVCMTLLRWEKKVLLTTPEQGGHPSIPNALEVISTQCDEIPYDYNKRQIDYEQTNKLIRSGEYRWIIFTQSDLLQPPDLSKLDLRNINVMYDATQTFGFIASKVIPNPLMYSDNLILMGGTHKTLPAPSCGLIMTNNESMEARLREELQPKLIRNTQPNTIAALLKCLIEQEKYGKDYQHKVVELANMLGKLLIDRGFNVVRISKDRFTETHQLFILMPKEKSEQMYQSASRYNVTLNRKYKKLFAGSGIRIGTQQIARYNWTLDELTKVADLLYMLSKPMEEQDNNKILQIKEYLLKLKIPQFHWLELTIE